MRKKMILDKDWRFLPIEAKDVSQLTLTPGPEMGRYADDSGWQRVDLPHDYQLDATFDKSFPSPAGFRSTQNAAYRKTFLLPEEYKDKHLTLCFEGIADQAIIYFNGSLVARSFSPYLPVYADISDRAFYGDRPNVISVFVDGISAQGWWYDGEGIYRHVYLFVREKLYFQDDGVYFRPVLKAGCPKDWTLTCRAEVRNASYETKSVTVRVSLYDGENRVTVFSGTSVSCPGDSVTESVLEETVRDPVLWEVDSPHLYSAKAELLCGETVLDEVVYFIGFRTFTTDKDTGFYLNGKPIKLMGTCNHQDHAGVGVAVPDSIQEYRIRRLKEMGTNAYRCAHNPPSRELLDACDRLGMLVMDETRIGDSSDEALGHLASMVRRDRNHPSIVLYSMSNEDLKFSEPDGGRVFRHMKSTVRKYDDIRMVTAALKGGYSGAEGSAEQMDAVGINYDIKNGLPAYRRKHPELCIFGSETNSALSTRGCYKTDDSSCRIVQYEATEIPPEGALIRDTWDFIRKNPWYGGAFIWTGFDYRGEPTPYLWPQTSSQFGVLDTCGFAKDSYYQCQACFRKEPMLHIVPHWNHKAGETIRVMTMTNCDEAELFLNGVSLGRKRSDCCDCAEWQVPFEPGTLSAVGYLQGKKAAEHKVMTAGRPVRIRIEPDRDSIKNDGMDAVPVNLCALDAEGIVCETAENLLRFEILEGGVYLGAGNGDPASHDCDRLPTKRLYAGHAQMILSAVTGATSVRIRVTGEGLEPAEFSFRVEEVPSPDFIPSVPMTEYYINQFELYPQTFRKMPDVGEVLATAASGNYQPVTVVPWWIVPRIREGYFLMRTSVCPKGAETKEIVLYCYRICAKWVKVIYDGIVVYDKAHKDGPLTIRIPARGGQEGLLYFALEAEDDAPSGLQESPRIFSVPDSRDLPR